MQISIDLTLMVLNSLELPPQFSLNEYIANIDEATYSTPVRKIIHVTIISSCTYYIIMYRY